jgi:hypothetical protein
MIPRSQQVYRLLQIAISMVVDSGMDGNDNSFPQHRTGTRIPLLHSKVESVAQLSHEEKRASLGCFYFSSVFVVHVHLYQKHQS